MVAQLGFVAKGLNWQYHPLRAVLLRMHPFFSSVLHGTMGAAISSKS